MIEVARADELIGEAIPLRTSEHLAVTSAGGRILRQAVVAERDQPPFDRVTMDGYALRLDWLGKSRSFAVAGTAAAGTPRLSLPEKPGCIEIMTGAICPEEADAIVPVERTTRNGEMVRIDPEFTPLARQFIHTRGSDRVKGATILPAGCRLGAPEMAILATSGLKEVEVASAPSIAVIATGNELVAPGKPIEPYQVRSSNEIAIATALTGCGISDVVTARLPDDRDVLLEQVTQLHERHDVLILSGGVSMGKYDYVPAVLGALGADVVFHKIRQRPGLPMWFGMSNAGKPLFALPGNPVSTLVCLRRYVIPAILASLGCKQASPARIALEQDVEFGPDLSLFLPVLVSSTMNSADVARPKPTNTSGDFISLGGTSGFVELPRGQDIYPAGFVADLYRW
jgi:molybdopterin molybdotransferase